MQQYPWKKAGHHTSSQCSTDLWYLCTLLSSGDNMMATSATLTSGTCALYSPVERTWWPPQQSWPLVLVHFTIQWREHDGHLSSTDLWYLYISLSSGENMMATSAVLTSGTCTLHSPVERIWWPPQRDCQAWWWGAAGTPWSILGRWWHWAPGPCWCCRSCWPEHSPGCSCWALSWTSETATCKTTSVTGGCKQDVVSNSIISIVPPFCPAGKTSRRILTPPPTFPKTNKPAKALSLITSTGTCAIVSSGQIHSLPFQY